MEMSDGVKTLIGRMNTHPEEFFGDAGKWNFIFKENYRDCLTELEKGAIHNALREVRRHEFTVRVMEALLAEELKEHMQEVDLKTAIGNYQNHPQLAQMAVRIKSSTK
jgi:type VI protein secretion system component VasK